MKWVNSRGLVQIGASRCRVCPLLEMNSQDVRDDDEDSESHYERFQAEKYQTQDNTISTDVPANEAHASPHECRDLEHMRIGAFAHGGSFGHTSRDVPFHRHRYDPVTGRPLMRFARDVYAISYAWEQYDF